MGDALVLCCDSSYVFGVVDIFVLYFFNCASKSILFKDVEKIPKKSCKKYTGYGCLSAYLCMFYKCVIDSNREKRNAIKLSIAFNIVNLSKM